MQSIEHLNQGKKKSSNKDELRKQINRVWNQSRHKESQIWRDATLIKELKISAGESENIYPSASPTGDSFHNNSRHLSSKQHGQHQNCFSAKYESKDENKCCLNSQHKHKHKQVLRAPYPCHDYVNWEQRSSQRSTLLQRRTCAVLGPQTPTQCCLLHTAQGPQSAREHGRIL